MDGWTDGWQQQQQTHMTQDIHHKITNNDKPFYSSLASKLTGLDWAEFNTPPNTV